MRPPSGSAAKETAQPRKTQPANVLAILGGFMGSKDKHTFHPLQGRNL
jgi:hypothetical protein